MEDEGGGGGGGSITGDGADGDLPSPTTPTARKISATDASPTHGVLEKNMSICSDGEKAEMEMGIAMGAFDSDSDTSDSEDDESAAVEMSEEEKRRRQRVKRDKVRYGWDFLFCEPSSHLIFPYLPCVLFLVEVLLYVHRNHRFIRNRSPGHPPRLSHSS